MSEEETLGSEELRHIVDFYLEPKNEWARSRIERVMASLSIKKPAPGRPGERILDLGCANGTFSFHAKNAGGWPVGLDRDIVVLKKGREASLAVGGFATPRVCGDARRLPFRTNSFDVVINADFIEHTPEEIKQGIYDEMHRVTAEGGRAVLYTPNVNRVRWELFGERLKHLVGLRKTPVPHWKDYVDADHFGMTSPHRTLRALRRSGYVGSLRYFEFHMPVLSKIPGADLILERVLSSQFANRFLIKLRKKGI